jgi:hypothetical protein
LDPWAGSELSEGLGNSGQTQTKCPVPVLPLDSASGSMCAGVQRGSSKQEDWLAPPLCARCGEAPWLRPGTLWGRKKSTSPTARATLRTFAGDSMSWMGLSLLVLHHIAEGTPVLGWPLSRLACLRCWVPRFACCDPALLPRCHACLLACCFNSSKRDLRRYLPAALVCSGSARDDPCFFLPWYLPYRACFMQRDRPGARAIRNMLSACCIKMMQAGQRDPRKKLSP